MNRVLKRALSQHHSWRLTRALGFHKLIKISFNGIRGISQISSANPTDQELITATLRRKGRDERRYPEFQIFLSRYEQKVRGWATHQLHDVSVVEEALQEAKYKMFRSGLKDIYSVAPGAYYWRVVKSCVLDIRAREKHHSHESIDPKDRDEQQTHEIPAADCYRPDVMVSSRSENECLLPVINEAFRRMVSGSPRMLRTAEILSMRYITGHKVEEIAKKVGIGEPNTVSQIIRRGLKDLAKILSVMLKEGFPGVEMAFEIVGKASP